MVLTLISSFVAGLVSSLSPCILPVAPIILLSAWQQHRLGPFALVTGLSISFTFLGLIFAATGNFIGFSPQGLRFFLSCVLILMGSVFIWKRIENLWTTVSSPLAALFHGLSAHPSLTGLSGQFSLGILLGGAWFPCMGPTLALAITLASQRQNLFEAGLIMLIYSLGAGLPLIALSYLSQQFWRKKWGAVSLFGKKALGVAMVFTGLLILVNKMEALETWFLMHSPAWLIHVTTRY